MEPGLGNKRRRSGLAIGANAILESTCTIDERIKVGYKDYMSMCSTVSELNSARCADVGTQLVTVRDQRLHENYGIFAHHAMHVTNLFLSLLTRTGFSSISSHFPLLLRHTL